MEHTDANKSRSNTLAANGADLVVPANVAEVSVPRVLNNEMAFVVIAIEIPVAKSVRISDGV